MMLTWIFYLWRAVFGGWKPLDTAARNRHTSAREEADG